jgi:sugar phosphate isomerase/epimerase
VKNKSLGGAEDKNIPAFNRRDFLAMVPAVAVASATGLGSEAAAETIPVGGHPYVYSQHRAELRQDTPLIEQIFSDMSYAGLDGIELMGAGDLNGDGGVARVRGLMRKYNLPVIGMSYSGPMWDRPRHATLLEQAQKDIGRLTEVGGHTLGISVGQTETKKTPEQLDAQADFLRKLLEICKSNGVKPNLHNHTYEVKDDEYDLKGTLARIPEAKLGPDLDWLVAGGVDPVDFIQRYKDKIIFAHLRDRKSDGKWPEAMGEGDLDYAAYGRALRAIGFSGDLVIELAHPGNFKLTRPLRESLKMSRQYVRRVMGY